jgi:membrane protein implicated in regulation of membrane protease activity
VKEFIVYTAARIGVFAVIYATVLGVAALVTDGPLPVLWPLVVAAVLSSVVSIYLLRGMRERFTEQVAARAGRMSERFEAMKAKEDVD